MWAFDTCNANSWAAARTWLRKTVSDVCLLQETKINKEPAFRAMAGNAKKDGWTVNANRAHTTAANLASGGTAVTAKRGLGIKQHAEDLVPALFQHRLAFSHVSAVMKGGVHCGSLWLKHSEGMSEDNMAILQAATAAVSKLKGPWIIGGDFNMEPATLEKSGWLEMIGGVVVAPTDPTCCSSVYDYFVVSKDLHDANLIVGVVRMTDGGFNPHHPVRLILRGDGRRKLIRELAKPTKIPGILPKGPLNKPAEWPKEKMEDMDVDGKLSTWYTRIRATLRSLSTDGKPNKLATAQTRWAPALKKPAEQEAGATWKSETWRILARRFTEVANLLHRNSMDTTAIITMHTRKARARVNSAKKAQDEKHLMQAWLDAAEYATAEQLVLLVKVADRWAEVAEREAKVKDAKDWKAWACNEQKCKSGRRLPSRAAFQWARSPSGWAKAIMGGQQCEDAVPDDLQHLEYSLEDNLVADGAEQGSSRIWTREELAPLGAQAEVDKTADEWAALWAEGADYLASVFPDDASRLAPLTAASLRKAALTFPTSTGTGADNLAPRALSRLDDEDLQMLADILNAMELNGQWARSLMMVIIVLIPKSDGGRRPIGLMPTVIRLWMRARSIEARKWEAANKRDSVYGGCGMGAQRAAWQATYQAEKAKLDGEGYVQSLLDLVKAFETVKHHHLVQAAQRHGWNPWLLRMSLAAYRAARVIDVDGVVSRSITAVDGITAGSGFATTELRVLLLTLVDATYEFYREIRFTFFVDDVTIEAFGEPHNVHTKNAMATSFVIHHFEDELDMEISATKSVAISSQQKLARKTVEALDDNKVQVKSSAKMLGVWGSGGGRRNTQRQKDSLEQVKGRTARVHALRQAGVCTRHLVQSSFGPATLYDAQCMGVSSVHLEKLRKAIAVAASPPTKGKNYEMILYMLDADGSTLDPAFGAHALPVGYYAQAWWDGWRSQDSLTKAFKDAERTLIKAKGSIWQVVTGPVAATIATVWRLGWTFKDPRIMITDRGEQLDVLLDSPAAFKKEIVCSVRRWKLAKVLAAVPGLKPAFTTHQPPSPSVRPPRGYEVLHWLPPDWHDLPWAVGKLLTGKSRGGKTVPQWNKACRPWLVSAATGGQWTQARLFGTKRGWTQDDRCQLCFQSTGTVAHRHCCPRTVPEGGWQTQGPNAAKFVDQLSSRNKETLRDRGLAVLRANIKPRDQEESVTWLKPIDDSANQSELTWYIDGSLLDGPRAITASTGAGFAAVDEEGSLAAYGHAWPPPWVKTIPGVEAWTLYKVLASTCTRKKVVTDCLGNVQAYERGTEWACDAKRPLARVWAPIMLALEDDVAKEALEWMPAHTTPSAVGTRLKSNGQPVTPVDHRANALVDILAKKAAEARRVALHLRELVAQAEQAIEHAAATLGAVTQAANHVTTTSILPDGTSCSKVERDATPMAALLRKAAAKALKVENERLRKEAEAKAVRVRLVAAAKRRLARKLRFNAEKMDLDRRVQLGRELAGEGEVGVTAPTANARQEAPACDVGFVPMRGFTDHGGWGTSACASPNQERGHVSSSDDDAMSLRSSAPGAPTRSRSASDENLFEPMDEETMGFGSFAEADMANVDFQWEYESVPDRLQDSYQDNLTMEGCTQFDMSDGEMSLDSGMENAVTNNEAPAHMDIEELFEPDVDQKSASSNQEWVMTKERWTMKHPNCEMFVISGGDDAMEDVELDDKARSAKTRSQARLTAGSGAGSSVPELEVGAEAPHPVAEVYDTSCPAEVDDGPKKQDTAAAAMKKDCYKPSAKGRGQAEAQVPGSARVLTAQQLNSQKQNARRAKLKAASKDVATPKVKARATAPQEGRILEAVADFWARKKAKTAKGEG